MEGSEDEGGGRVRRPYHPIRLGADADFLNPSRVKGNPCKVLCSRQSRNNNLQRLVSDVLWTNR